jgi:hypothetical protein
MNRTLFRFAIVLLWLALPLVALEYRQVWDRLPAQVATHFNAANQANGWMSRQESLNFSLRMMAVLLTVSTIALAAISRRKVETLSWALLGFFAVIIGLLVAVNQAIVDYNVYGTTPHPERMMIVPAAAVIALIAVLLMSHRQAPLPDGETLAVETHASHLWTIVILLAFAGPMLATTLASRGARWPLLPIGAVGLALAAMVWRGFQYRFRQHGVEVRTLGLRLRSIPRSSIVTYSIEPWSWIRGYGIRGIGSTRAYVWCNKVVHIKTTNGDVYLGHTDPERIVRDLDAVMHSSSVR